MFSSLRIKTSALALAIVFAVGSLFAATPQIPVAAASSLPECRYDDIVTSHLGRKQWRITLLDTIYMAPKSYVPRGLVSTSGAGLNAGGKVRRLVIGDLAAMASAADAAGAKLRVVSAYRSFRLQKRVYNREVRQFGESAARLTVARPGHSEHQLGTTIDFGSAKSAKDAWDYSDWAKTAAGSWMQQNAWQYGFIMSYPKRKKSVTCYRYEPWHYRYVGRELAQAIHDSGLTTREYLWYNFESIEPPDPS